MLQPRRREGKQCQSSEDAGFQGVGVLGVGSVPGEVTLGPGRWEGGRGASHSSPVLKIAELLLVPTKGNTPSLSQPPQHFYLAISYSLSKSQFKSCLLCDVSLTSQADFSLTDLAQSCGAL